MSCISCLRLPWIDPSCLREYSLLGKEICLKNFDNQEQWPNCLNIKNISSAEFLSFFLGIWGHENHFCPGLHSHPWECQLGDGCRKPAHLLCSTGWLYRAFPLEPEFLDQERPGLSLVASVTPLEATMAVLYPPPSPNVSIISASQPPGDGGAETPPQAPGPASLATLLPTKMTSTTVGFCWPISVP